MSAPLLAVDNLGVSFGSRQVLSGMGMTLTRGRIHAVVGESGSGKTMTALAAIGLLPQNAVATGEIRLDGSDTLSLPEQARARLRGDDIAMVFQEPMTALNPLKTIGEQVAEGIRWHGRLSGADAAAEARRMLDRVGLPSPQFGLDRYPHELSGGQRQRVVIAMACAMKPRILIADEPTTALDVVLQKQILDLLRELVDERQMALMLISHDLGVVADMADDISILKDGRLVEQGEAVAILAGRHDPYTRKLAEASSYRPERKPIARRVGDEPILSVTDVSKTYRTSIGLFSRPQATRAVDGVSLSIARGEIVSLVGRSGCGKSTLARMTLALERPDAGTITIGQTAINTLHEHDLRPVRRRIQVVFQDPYSSFDPRQTVERIICEPLHLLDVKPTREASRRLAADALAKVGLGEEALDRYPHQFSGGQRQRIAIARAIITEPDIIIADEPVSALDVSIRAQILDLFADLNRRLGLALLFITHDLTVARGISDRVLVMDKGRIVEEGPPETVLDTPVSEAARVLVESAPDLERALAARVRQGARERQSGR